MFRPPTSAYVIAIACLATSVPAPAQQPAESTPPTIPAITLDFAGGTAADYIAALRRASPEANIVVLGDLARIHMAAVQLKNVDVLSALSVLDQLPSEQGSFVAKVHVSNVASSQDVPDLYTVAAEVHNRGAAPNTMETTVISMADLLGDNLKSSDALTSIQIALELIGEKSEPAQIKFHEETGLLICRGTPEQTESIAQVIRQLRERAGTLEVRAQRAMHEQQNAADAKNAQRERDELRAENTALAHDLNESKMRSELLEQSLDVHRKQLAVLEDEIRTLRAERDQLAREIADLRSKIKEPAS